MTAPEQGGSPRREVIESVLMPHRKFPCEPCPIVAANRDNPDAKFPVDRWDTLTQTVPEGHDGASVPPSSPFFSCHRGTPGAGTAAACAGWLAVFGSDHIGVRFAVCEQRLPVQALDPGPNWPALHQSWVEVREHQTWQPGDPDGHLDDR